MPKHITAAVALGILGILALLAVTLSPAPALSHNDEDYVTAIILGTATASGKTAPAGTEIIAVVGSEVVGRTTVRENGHYEIALSQPSGLASRAIFIVASDAAPLEYKSGDRRIMDLNFFTEPEEETAE